jgi:hypothetical protein
VDAWRSRRSPLKDGRRDATLHRDPSGETSVSILDDDTVRGLLIQSWHASQPGTDVAHEEGGFVLLTMNGSLEVERWPQGAQNQILVPPHPGGKRGGLLIVATFHTHPNIGPDFQQEPSLTDIRAVRDDPDLSHPEYEGEYVISSDWIYRIQRNGRVQLFGEFKAILKTT